MFKTISTYSPLFNRYLEDGDKIGLDTLNDIFLLILPLMFSNIDKENQEDLALFNNLILFLKGNKPGFTAAFNRQKENLKTTERYPSFESTVAMHAWYKDLINCKISDMVDR
ncbi:MAG: hypothetical protein ACON35_05515 [Candidatus Marinamargulisbacteria bacterium]